MQKKELIGLGAAVAIILIVVAIVTIFAGEGDDGQPPEPTYDLEIQDWYDLDAVRDNLAGKYILINNLDAGTAGYDELASPTANEGKGWRPIGTRDPFEPFTGTFYGQGYEIRDLCIDRPFEDDVGLFGIIGAGGVVEDVGVVNADVTGGQYVGGLVGYNSRGVVSNSYLGGGVVGGPGIGGLVGANHGTVSNSYSRGNVIGDRIIGGLVGNNMGTVIRCYSMANVASQEWGIGGLVGHSARTGGVIDSYSNGNVTGGQYVGGLVGYNLGILKNSYSTSPVTGEEYLGGLVASTGPSVIDCFWDRESSGVHVSDGGTGNTTAAMQDVATFLGAAWNITAVSAGETDAACIWNIVDGETYPFLSWQSVD